MKLPVPIITALLSVEHKEKSKFCPCLAVMEFSSRCCLSVQLCTSPEQRLWDSSTKPVWDAVLVYRHL